MPRGQDGHYHALAMTLYAVFGLVYTAVWFWAYNYLNFPPELYWFMILSNIGWFAIYLMLAYSWGKTADNTRGRGRR